LLGRTRKWIAPFLAPPEERKSGLLKDIAIFLKHTKEQVEEIKAREEARKRGEIVPEDGEFEFFGRPVTIRGFRDEIDLAGFKVFGFIDDFWSMENFNKIKAEIDSSSTDTAFAEMRDLFLPQLSEKCRQLLAGPVEGVHKDIDTIYRMAFEKMQERICGLSEDLVVKLNNILNITFQPVDLQAVGESLSEIFKTFDRLVQRKHQAGRRGL
jgi:hypothetical protein